MAFSVSSLCSEVGLRVLFSPLSSNIVTRAACCSIGVGLPVYFTVKSLENKHYYDQQKWLVYWSVYGSFSLVEALTDKILNWFPLYYHVKFSVLVWFQLPNAEGSKVLYKNYLRLLFLRHQARLDKIIGAIYAEMVKFAIAHERDIQYANDLFWKLYASVNGVIHPNRQSSRSIEGPSRRKLDTGSESEEDY